MNVKCEMWKGENVASRSNNHNIQLLYIHLKGTFRVLENSLICEMWFKWFRKLPQSSFVFAIASAVLSTTTTKSIWVKIHEEKTKEWKVNTLSFCMKIQFTFGILFMVQLNCFWSLYLEKITKKSSYRILWGIDVRDEF